MRKRSVSAKVIEVIQVKTFIGDGTDKNPYHGVTEFWSLSGELLAVTEPPVASEQLSCSRQEL